jgi:hypothetical protein
LLFVCNTVLGNLFADVRFAVRWLRRSPAFTAIAIASLAIGIGFNTALFTIVDALVFRPLPVERVDRLVDVFTSSSDDDQYATSSYPDFLDFKSQNQVFSDMLAYSPAFGAVKLTDRSRLVLGETVTGNYFQMLGVRAIAGRTLVPDDDKAGAPRVAVISYRLWNREYGLSPSTINQSIHIHGQPYTIVESLRGRFHRHAPLLGPAVDAARSRRCRARRNDQHSPSPTGIPASSGADPLDVRQRTFEGRRHVRERRGEHASR